MMQQVRNFILRLSINYIVLSVLLVLAGWGIKERQLFGTWSAAFVFTILTVTVRRFLLALSLPLIIMSAGLFICVIDGIILSLTAAFTSLRVTNVWWVVVGVLVMSVANIWVEKAFWSLGWLRANNTGTEQEVNVLTAQSPSWIRRWLLLAILLGGVAFSAAMAAQVFLLAGQITRSMTTITTVAGSALSIFVFGISWLVAEGLALHRRALFAGIVTILVSAVVITPVSLLLFAPAPDITATGSQYLPDTTCWELPTGSRIAYRHLTSQTGIERNPIIYLHGGLGRAVLDTDITFFREFTDEGFDIYLYDLVGTGLSGRLDDIRDYNISRHVDDLEAIREMIKADRLMIVAHAEGAEIAVRYMIKHQDRVERVVFYSPTPMWNDQDYFKGISRTAVNLMTPAALESGRQTVALALGLYSPRTAQAYVSQEEMTYWSDRLTDEGLMVCAGDEALAPIPRSPGYNAYVSLMGDITDDIRPDPRVRLREVFVPTILLRGECDYVDWGVVLQYWEAVPNIQVYYVKDAGSMLHLSQPDLVQEILLAFFNEQPVPLKPLTEASIRLNLPLLDEVQ